MKPITREEQYLNKLTGEEQSIAEPITREEQYLSRLCGADNIIPQTPETRREAYLAALCGEEVETPEPETRIEQYMNFAAGKSQSKPEKAITREEMYWDKYQGGAVPEEKTVQGDIIHITDATGDNAVALSVALTPTQDGTPWISDTLNTEPYLSRAAQNGNTADETIVGGTVAWNQLVDSNTTEVPTISGRKYLTVISGTKSIIAGNGTSISVTGGTDNVHDLTQMFGSTIADYVYSLETATTGAGMAWLRSHGFIDDNYHAYNPGELISAKPTAKIVGDTTYALGGADLRGLFKLDANNNLYCDGDVYTSDGTITRKYGIVDLGTLNYATTASRLFSTDSLISIIKRNSNTARPTNSIITPLYTEVDANSITGPQGANPSPNMAYAINTVGRLYFNNTSYTSASDFKAAMSGVYLVYELKTPTTEVSTAYTNPQKAGEAEAFVDARTEKVPVGHSTRYSAEYAINGFEGVTVHVSETQTGGTTYPVTFTSQGTVYGGTIDVVSGELKITWGYIASYNGETLPGVWMSSKEVYAEGTSPSLGAEVSYILSTPITATIDPTTIELNEGENYVWTEEGTTALTYMAKAAQRVLAMNRTLQKNLKSIELKKGGDVR